jgi:hypothetical protein
MQYADPDVAPNPIAMQMEVRDKDSVLVYGPEALTYQEQKSQVFWWNGKDNCGNLVNMENGPFMATIGLQYQSAGMRNQNALWIFRLIRDLLPNVIYVKRIEPKNNTNIWLKDPLYPPGPVYEAEWNKMSNTIEIKKDYPFADYIELMKDNDKTKQLRFDLEIELASVYSLSVEKLNTKLYFKISGFDDMPTIYGWNGLTRTINYTKNFGIPVPRTDVFGERELLMSVEYSFQLSDKQYIETDMIRRPFWLFFQHLNETETNHPELWPFASYNSKPEDDGFIPNWFRYWTCQPYYNGDPYNTNNIEYDHNMADDGQFRPFNKPLKYYLGHGAGLPGSIEDTLRKPIGEQLNSIFFFSYVCRHENRHRSYFNTWWPEGYDINQDDDRDLIPNQVEQDSFSIWKCFDNTKWSHNRFEDFEFINYLYHQDWYNSIKDNNDIIKSDWGYPGEQANQESRK